jgi:hypothetical protein
LFFRGVLKKPLYENQPLGKPNIGPWLQIFFAADNGTTFEKKTWGDEPRKLRKTREG